MYPGKGGEDALVFGRGGVFAEAEGGVGSINVLGDRFKRVVAKEAGGEVFGEEDMLLVLGQQHHRTALMGGLDRLEEVVVAHS